LDGFWTTDRFNVDGDIVVAAPARDVVIVTGWRAWLAIFRPLTN